MLYYKITFVQLNYSTLYIIDFISGLGYPLFLLVNINGWLAVGHLSFENVGDPFLFLNPKGSIIEFHKLLATKKILGNRQIN